MNKRIAAIFGLFLFAYSNLSFAGFAVSQPSSNCPAHGKAFPSLGLARGAAMACVQKTLDSFETYPTNLYYTASISSETDTSSPLDPTIYSWTIEIERVWQLEPNKGEISHIYVGILIHESPEHNKKELGTEASEPKENKACPISQNPIHLLTGNKLKSRLDYSGNDISPLSFKRYYNSFDTKTSIYGLYTPRVTSLGLAWRHTYDRSIEITNAGNAAEVNRADGSLITFNNYAGAGWVSDTDITATLINTSTGFQYKTRNTIEEYNTAGQLQTITNINGRRQSLSYNGDGTLATVTDDLGNALIFNYVAANLQSIISPDGRQWRYGYDAYNNLTTVTNPDNTVLTYRYENATFPNNLTGITDERNIASEHYVYDYSGRAIRSYKGNIADNISGVTVQYDNVGNSNIRVTGSTGAENIISWVPKQGTPLITSTTGPGCASCGSAGNSSYEYDGSNNVTSNTKNGVTTNYGNYDVNGNYGYKEIAVGTPEQRRIDYAYDPRFYSKVTTITEPSVAVGQSKVTTIVYDNFGNLTSLTINGFTPTGTAVSRTTTFKYNGPLNQLSEIDGPRTDVADITTIDYYPNDAGQGNNRARVQRIATSGIITRDNIQYTVTGKVQSEQRPNGLNLIYDYYPGNDRLKSIIQTGGTQSTKTEWTYLASGEVETITRHAGSPASSTITLGYDDARRLDEITDDKGNRIQYTLDTEGNKTGTDVFDNTSQLKRALSQTYDLYNELDTASQENEFNDYTFSPDGTLDKVTNANNVTTDYNYDALKRLIDTTQDLGGSDPATANATSIYKYDVQDNLTNVIDPKGNMTGYVYDDLGNLLTQTSPDTGITNSTYDEAGNVITKDDANGNTITYAYDALNRIKTAATNDGRNTLYLYDQNATSIGRLSSVADNDSTISYLYNAFGNVTDLTQVTAGQTKVLSYQYNSLGQATHITYPSGAVVEYVYTADEITSVLVNGQPVLNNIQYEAFGSVKSWQWGNGIANSRVYDLAGRLKEYTLADKTRSLYLNNVGNIEHLYDDSVTKLFTYDNLYRLIGAEEFGASFRFDAIQYDINGNRTEYFKYDGSVATDTYNINTGSNRLSSISGANAKTYSHDNNGNILNDGSHSYQYDARNRLIQVDGSVNYVLNPLGQRAAKFSATSYYYHYDTAGQLIGEYDTVSTDKTEYIYFNNAPIALIRNGNVYHIHTDHLGTPRVVTTSDPSNTVLWKWNSDAFGNTQPNEDVDGDGTNFVMNLRFPGQYYDAETGLHYNYFRDYDPSTGRYIQSDPIGLSGGLNTYGYVGGNPLKFIDPTGEFAILYPIAIGIGEYGTALLGGTALFAALTVSGDSVKSDSQCKTKDDDYCSKNAERLNVERNFLIDAQGMILGGSNARDQETLTALNNDIVKFNREVSEHNKLCPNLRVLPLRTLGQQGVRY